MCTERVLPTVRRAYRALRGLASVQPFIPSDCVGRLYNRLNDDYRPMHALCRFFLEHSGPSHEIGNRTILPFLVNMARLYELFVAEWLKQHLLPKVGYIRAQDRVTLGNSEQTLRFDIDLTLYDAQTHQAVCVLDTKYKRPDKVSNDDLYQVVAYAEAKQCREAILIYPEFLESQLDVLWGNIRVRSLTFAIDGDL